MGVLLFRNIRMIQLLMMLIMLQSSSRLFSEPRNATPRSLMIESLNKMHIPSLDSFFIYMDMILDKVLPEQTTDILTTSTLQHRKDAERRHRPQPVVAEQSAKNICFYCNKFGHGPINVLNEEVAQLTSATDNKS